MDLNISALADVNVFPFSHSQAEGGENAVVETWTAAREQALRTPLLTTKDHFQEFKEYVAEFGAWDTDEIAEFGDLELNTLLIQMIAGDLREMGFDHFSDMPDNHESERIQKSGKEIFYYIGI